MVTYGKIGEFKESEESWTQYVERLEQYFLANEVEDCEETTSNSTQCLRELNIRTCEGFTSTSEASGDNFQEDCRHP